jgi:tripartite-type tricarboxylate transporter receptor subunit TctC
MIEAGVPNFDASVWWALVAPKGTPAEVVNRINLDLAKIMTLPDLRETYAKLGVATAHSTPARITETIKAESPLMARILKAAGVDPE